MRAGSLSGLAEFRRALTDKRCGGKFPTCRGAPASWKLAATNSHLLLPRHSRRLQDIDPVSRHAIVQEIQAPGIVHSRVDARHLIQPKGRQVIGVLPPYFPHLREPCSKRVRLRMGDV